MSNWRIHQRGFAAAADCELHDQCAQNKCTVPDDGASCTANGELALTSSLHALQPAHICLLLILALLHAYHLPISCVKPTVQASQCPCVYHYIIKADTAIVAGWHASTQTSSGAICTSHRTCLAAYKSQNYCCVLCSTWPCWVQLIAAMALSALRSSPARLLKVLGATATAQVKFKLVQRMLEAALKLACAAAIAHPKHE